MTLNRIAYVDDRGDLYTVDPAGQDRRLTVPAGAGRPRDREEPAVSAINWPAWSPDSRRIAFSWVGRTTGQLMVRLLVADLEENRIIPIFDNPSDVPPGIAPNLPHYVAWSPDGAWLAFLTMTAAGQTLFLAPADGSAPVQPVAVGAPFFPIWAPDSRRLLIHLADELYEVEVGEAPRSLEAASTAYRVPAWSPDGRRRAFVEDTAGGSRLVIADGEISDRRDLGAVTRGVALIWAPAGDLIAISQPPSPGAAYRGIEIVDPVLETRRRLTTDDLLAFFWSPDGGQILYVGVDLNASEMAWATIGLDGRKRRLATFVPSRDTMTALTFFDQYATSVRFWSPDSRSIVFAGRLGQPARMNGRDGSAAHHDQIYVLDVWGEIPPRVVGEGTLGFWSWR